MNPNSVSDILMKIGRMFPPPSRHLNPSFHAIDDGGSSRLCLTFWVKQNGSPTPRVIIFYDIAKITDEVLKSLRVAKFGMNVVERAGEDGEDGFYHMAHCNSWKHRWGINNGR